VITDTLHHVLKRTSILSEHMLLPEEVMSHIEEVLIEMENLEE
jgi:hypothetical protein